MRLLPLLLLTACGRLGPFAPLREDTADTGDTDLVDDTGVVDDSDTGPVDTDTGPVDTDTGPATREGVYNGTFTMNVMMSGFPIPVGDCIGPVQIVVTTSSASGAFDCTFTMMLEALGPQTGEVTATVSGASVVDPYAELGLFFVFDELSGSFQGTDALLLTEAGTVTIELGTYDYTAEFDVSK